MDAHPLSCDSARLVPSPLVAGLTLGRYRLEFEAQDEVRFPAFAGSAWRGLFGHALKQIVCVTREPTCDRCLLQRSCVYPYIFETPPPADSDRLRRYPAAPHPYVIRLSWGHRRAYSPGERVTLDVHLIGKANDHLPYVLHAFHVAGAHGFGSERARLALLSVAQLSDRGDREVIYERGGALTARPPSTLSVPPLPARWQVQIETPLRLTGNDRLVSPERFAFHELFRNVLRRLSSLCYFHTDQELEVDFRGLTAASREVSIADRALTWQDWNRYSGRQHTRMTLGGLMGRFEVEGEDLAPFWPYLWVGQWVHAGKGTVMGLGRYRIEAAATLPSQTHEAPGARILPAGSEAREV
jgi:hypothetical protein